MKNLKPIMLILVFFLLSLGAHIILAPFAPDDAYIHLRIARNFLEAGVPYYNLDEAVMGSSSALWTLYLAVLFSFFKLSPYVVAIGNSVFSTASGVAFAGALRRYYKVLPLSPLPAWTVIAVAGALMPAGAQLMETPLAIFLLALGLNAYAARRAYSFFFFGLMIFARLELLLFLAVFIMHAAVKKTTPIKGMIFWLLVSVTPLVAFNMHFFGTNIPQTVVAKNALYALSTSEVLAIFIMGLLGKSVFYSQPVFSLCSVIVVVLSLLILIVILRRELLRESLLILWLPSLMLIALYFIRGVFIFPWYVPLYLVPLSVACVALVCTNPAPLVRYLAVLLLFPALLSFGLNIGLAISSPRYFTEIENGVWARAYAEAGRELNERYPGQSLMAPEIGGLGYEYFGKIFDAAGLVTPKAVGVHEVKTAGKRDMRGSLPVELVEMLKPGIVAGYALLMEEFERSEPRKLYCLEEYAPLIANDSAFAGNIEASGRGRLRVYINGGIFSGKLPGSMFSECSLLGQK